MKKYMPLILILSLLMISCNSPKEEKNNMEDLKVLKRNVKATLNTVQGDFAMAFKMVGNDSISLYINEKEGFHAASTMKTPVMIELYKQVENGAISLDDSVMVINEFKSIVDGSPYSMDISVDSQEGLYGKIGQKTTYRELNYEMITKSSNLATNILIDHLDAKKVNQSMRDLGATDIQVLRGVEDIKAYELGMSNTTTAYDLMLIMEAIAKGEAVNQEASKEMIGVLKDQHFKELIPAKLPKEVIVAHKTGSITGVRHDSGIVQLPDGRKYVLVLLSKNMENPDQGVAAMAEVSKMIYDYVMSLD
ncbi:class A beta-lactamase-related serine hydrolase [Echinicola marina]|uniref:serine hydrolase n=1 Tax=Echinicola marina TaxID=2859768 RepID=UPI001CF60CE0|nr:serine hydrolase [Echinicola marina]UCS93150.1 class A beta-lactamase-related serine hydrolase [Echinicola marina]